MAETGQATMPSVPLHVFFSEAVGVAAFFDRRWATQKDAAGNVTRLGLDSARKLPEDTGAAILSALALAQAAHTAWLFIIDPSTGPDLRMRAEFVLSEIIIIIDWYLDDGVTDDNDARFAKLGQVHGELGESAAAIALALDDYAALATPMRDALDGLAGFDAKMLDEAPMLAAKLRALSPSPRRSEAAQAALADRNAKIAAVYDLVRRVRAAAQVVYRGEPEVVREVTSAWERRTRAERLRAKKAAEAAGTPG